MKKAFIEFLKLNGVYNRFVDNAYNHHHATIDGIQNRNPMEVWVQAAFDWQESPEGHDYWLRIHNLWIHSLNTK